MMSLVLLWLAIAWEAAAFPAQRPLGIEIDSTFEPLKHLSAISPFFIPTEVPTPLPPSCHLTSACLLIRHSAILGNDDEYEDTMLPFIDKVKGFDRDKLPDWGGWGFLKDWETPIVEDTLEQVSERGKKDAEWFGNYTRHHYGSLFPDPKKHKGSDRPSYKVWTASSQRDIDSAKAYVLGSFPDDKSGEGGEGDGDIVQLIKVPNKAKDWDRSLTPHKACDAFEKQSSLKPANKWLKVYAAKIRERLEGDIPHLAPELSDQDILAMQMLCGYESIAQGSSLFCHLFTREEWLDLEYYFDIRWFHAIGYGSYLSPYLGLPWVKTAAHLLETETDGNDDDLWQNDDDQDILVSGGWKGVKKLPKTKVPPNATHSQLLFPSFTHRESPVFVAVFLNLYNASFLEHPASEVPPLDHRLERRAWRSSRLISFLGHVALERFECDTSDEVVPDSTKKHNKKGKKDGQSYVRAVVNGKQEVMGGCEDGPGGACKWGTFRDFVDGRVEKYGDWESVCDV